jgi:PAS domain S-box-containing protein
LEAPKPLNILYTSSEPLFESLAQLAALTFKAPIALISLVDEERQWFEARVGLDVDRAAGDISFCQHAILSDDIFMIPDAAEDERFRDNPLVTGPPAIRFYAGAPLITPEGRRLGTVCVIDTGPRAFTDADASRLRVLAQSVMQALLMRRDGEDRERIATAAARQTKLLELAEDMAGVGTWSWDVAADRTTWSNQVYRIHGYEPAVEPPTLQGVLKRYHPDDAKLLADHVRRAVAQGLDYALEARIYRQDGSERHVIARGVCRKDAHGAVAEIVGTFQDVTEHVAVVHQLSERKADLRRMLERHRQLINGADDYAIYWLDPKGCVESWNTGAQRMKGYEESEIVGRHYSTFFSDGDRAAGEPERILSTALRHGKCVAEGWRIRKDGSAFWSEVTVEAVYDDTGALIGFAKISRDVSERQALERSRNRAHDDLQKKTQALAASEEKYALAVSGMSVGVWDWDVIANRLYWSERFMEMLGVAEADFLPCYEEFGDRLHPDDLKVAEAALRGHVENKNAYDIEYRLRHNQGHYIWVHATGQAIWNDRGELRRMAGSAADITAFKRQQQALIESEETFRTALENAVVGNALVATNGRWLKVNRALCTLLGFEEADLLRDGDALIQHPDDPWVVRETVEDLMSGASTIVERERFLRHRDGHQLWVKVCASMVTRGDGATDYLMVQFQDLTERKRAEIVKDEFVSTVNHELRTPLTSIFGSLRLLGATTAGKLDAKSQRLLEVAQISCTQLTRLVNDILDLEKIAAGKMDYHLETLPAGPLIKDIIKRHSAIADGHGVRFNTRLELDGLALRVDPNRFNQALVNLLSNAAKYSPTGGHVDILAKREGGAAIRISVTDHGPGIPAAFRATIFGRFAQADTSTTRKVGGSGLGLNITKTLIEAFGGTVAFDSIEGQGATFHFVLPCFDILATELELEAHD